MSKKVILALAGLVVAPLAAWIGAYGLFSMQNVFQLKDPAAQATETLKYLGSMGLCMAALYLFASAFAVLTEKNNWKRDDEQ